MIIELELAPGDVVREDRIRARLGFGRTPIREAIQRLARDQFVTIVPRQGVFVTGLDVSELSMLYETRAVLEPYAARLAAVRGTEAAWDEMEAVLAGPGGAAVGETVGEPGGGGAVGSGGETAGEPGGGESGSGGVVVGGQSMSGESTGKRLLAVDRRCHEIIWHAAGNRFLLDTLDMLYAQSDRLWHMYLANDVDMSRPLRQHREILDGLRARDGAQVAELVERHVREFDEKVRNAVAGQWQSVRSDPPSL